jgi:hypothetical protein
MRVIQTVRVCVCVCVCTMYLAHRRCSANVSSRDEWMDKWKENKKVQVEGLKRRNSKNSVNQVSFCYPEPADVTNTKQTSVHNIIHRGALDVLTLLWQASAIPYKEG